MQNQILMQARHVRSGAIPQNAMGGKIAWVHDMLDEEDGIVTLNAQALEEIDGVMKELRGNPLSIEFIDPKMFRAICNMRSAIKPM